MHYVVLFVAALMAAFATPPTGAPPATGAPRVLIVLEDGGPQSSPERFARAALEHLGLVLETHAASAPLPAIEGRDDVRGVLIWLDHGTVGDAAGFAVWTRALAQRGVPVVLMGKTPEIENRFDFFLALGLLYTHDERAYTYDLRAVDRDNDVIDFERHFDNLFPEADIIRPLDTAQSHSILELQRRGDVTDRTHPLLITPKGGYAADGYAVWVSADGAVARWYVDPVAFFRLALKLDAAPVPDATVLNGRRIFSATAESADAAPASKAAALGLVEKVISQSHDLPLEIAIGVTPAWTETVIPTASACQQHARALMVGFGGTAAALANLDAPYQLTPFAPRFSVCSDQAPALAAIQAVFAQARAIPLHPITAVRLGAIDHGFGSVQIQPIGGRVWRVLNRGDLQTLRVDGASGTRIDWANSEGLVGAARVGDRLYISLDPANPAPSIALTDTSWAPAPYPVSIESRWQIANVERDATHVTMQVEGFGPGDMSWAVAPHSQWELRFTAAGGRYFHYRAEADDKGVLAFSLPAQAHDPATLTLQLHQGGGP